MSRVWISSLLLAGHMLVPVVASACAVCLDSAWGDRGFNGAFVGLMLAPWVLAAALVGILAWGWARRDRRVRAPDEDRPGR